jgi:hypothetical protein
MSFVLVRGGDEMYFNYGPRDACALPHKRPPFSSRMRPARISARPRIFGAKINECTIIVANLVREGVLPRSAWPPLEWNVGLSISHARVRRVTYGFVY